MSIVNYNKKKIHCKIVYYGPEGSGKTTNIKQIYEYLSRKDRNDFTKMQVKEDEMKTEGTLTFDFLPINVGKVRGLQVHCHLYAAPGKKDALEMRQLILNSVDGVIFVADSRKEKRDENAMMFKELETNLSRRKYEIDKIPVIFQYNKRDLKNIYSVSQMRSFLNFYRFSEFEAVATKGDGVLEALNAIIETIFSSLKK